MSDWIVDLRNVVNAGQAAALVTVVATEGSAPRDAGTKMIVTAGNTLGTVGGGQLEYAAIRKARERLSGGGEARMERFPLGPQLGQCCGGSATLLFETLDAAALEWLDHVEARLEALEPAVLVTSIGNRAEKRVLCGPDLAGSGFGTDLGPSQPVLIREQHRGNAWVAEWLNRPSWPLFLFGAGHVGRALVRALAPLPFRVTWIDSRPEAFPEQLPANVTAEHCDPQRFAVERAPAECLFLTMSHSHAIDFEVCEAVLRRDDTAYLGLIGSRTKRARFLSRLRARGLGAERLERLACPIGLPGIGGKEPAVIAASVAADLLRRKDALEQARHEDKAGHAPWLSTAER